MVVVVREVAVVVATAVRKNDNTDDNNQIDKFDNDDDNKYDGDDDDDDDNCTRFIMLHYPVLDPYKHMNENIDTQLTTDFNYAHTRARETALTHTYTRNNITSHHISRGCVITLLNRYGITSQSHEFTCITE